MDLIFICMDLYNLFVPLWFFFSFIPSYLHCSLYFHIWHMPFIYNFCSIFVIEELWCFYHFLQHQKVVPVSITKWHFSHSLIHYIILPIYLSVPSVYWGSFNERGSSHSILCVMIVLCINSWMLGTKFISLQSQKILHYQLETTL